MVDLTFYQFRETMGLRRLFARFRAAWTVMRAERVVVITYDPKQPANILGEIHTGMCRTEELPQRLISAALVANEADKMDSEEGQWNALRRAREILGLNSHAQRH